MVFSIVSVVVNALGVTVRGPTYGSDCIDVKVLVLKTLRGLFTLVLWITVCVVEKMVRTVPPW